MFYCKTDGTKKEIFQHSFIIDAVMTKLVCGGVYWVETGLFLRKVARECQNARVISFARAIAQVKIHKHCLFLGKASYNESRYYYCQMRMNR